MWGGRGGGWSLMMCIFIRTSGGSIHSSSSRGMGCQTTLTYRRWSRWSSDVYQGYTVYVLAPVAFCDNLQKKYKGALDLPLRQCHRRQNKIIVKRADGGGIYSERSVFSTYSIPRFGSSARLELYCLVLVLCGHQDCKERCCHN